MSFIIAGLIALGTLALVFVSPNKPIPTRDMDRRVLVVGLGAAVFIAATHWIGW